MNLSELIPFLKRLETRPKKGLSQNFLIDLNVVDKIIDLAAVTEDDVILEIGPGPGALTKALLKTNATVIAVEFDTLFARELERLQNGKLEVFHADFLKFPLSNLPENIKVVANLPYHITTPILEKLFTHSFSNLTIMVQTEVANRMKAKPYSKEFGSLSLFVQFHSNVHSSFNVPASCFYPVPKVGSTVIRLDKAPLRDVNESHFFSLVHKAFQKRRKMITSSLDIPKEKVREALLKIGARVDARPEMLGLDEWIMLSKELAEFIL